jgi:transglutaminase-like putative cysteine protease
LPETRHQLATRTTSGYSLGGYLAGDQGTRSTLMLMRELARRWRGEPRIRDLARSIVADCPAKHWRCEVTRLHSFVQSRVRYIRDPRGFEVVQDPEKTLADGSGDCDDHSVLLASLLESVGHPARFVAMGVTPAGGFVHVFTETRLGPGWVAVETTEPWAVGQRPQRVGRTMVVRV